MDRYLYILCEGETDEMFYERLAERLTGLSFELSRDFRVRPGANYKTAVATAKMLLSRVKQWTGTQEVAVIIAVDNDRAPGHPGGTSQERALPGMDGRKAARYPALQTMVAENLGTDRARRPVDVALAVPVEMIESWLLLLLDPERGELPIYPEASAKLARMYWGGNPPPQLKDLRDAACKGKGVTKAELFFDAADQGDLEKLAERSRSFAMFREELLGWRGVQPT